MKITKIKTIPVSIPTEDTKSSLGAFSTYDFGIVIIETDEGIEGYGEISTLWDGNGHLQCNYVNDVFEPLLFGEDPRAINKCMSKIRTLIEPAYPAKAAIDMALFDILGKFLNVPIYQILGGKYRDDVVLSHSIHMASIKEMAEKAARYVSEGYTCVKAKIGLDREHDLLALSEIRKAIGPDIQLRVDANMAWRNAKEAIRSIKELEQFNLHSVEQPIPPGNISQMKFIRDSVDVPIMVDESVWGPNDAWEILTTHAADMINVYVTESGGLRNSSLIFRMSELVNVPCLIGAMPELGIGTSAAVHLGVAMPNLEDPCDASGSIYQVVDVINEQFIVKNGRIAPMEGPGLGVTLNKKAISKYAK